MAIEAVPVRQRLSKRLRSDRRFRSSFFDTLTRNRIASQLRRLRKLRHYNQADLKRNSLHQSHISRIEQAQYSSWTYKTLWKVTDALDGVLEIYVRPVEDVLSEYEANEREEAARIADVEKARALGPVQRGVDTSDLACRPSAVLTADQANLNRTALATTPYSKELPTIFGVVPLKGLYDQSMLASNIGGQ